MARRKLTMWIDFFFSVSASVDAINDASSRGRRCTQTLTAPLPFRQNRSTYIYASESLAENGHGIHYLVFQEHECFFHLLASVDDNNND